MKVVNIHYDEKNSTRSYSINCKNVAEAAQEIELEVSQILKSLLINAEDHYLLVLIPSDKQLSFEKLESIYHQKFKMASANEVYEITGCKIGSVSPFKLKTPLDIIIEQDCLKILEVGVGSGTRGKEIILDPNLLISDLNATQQSLVL